MTRRILSTAALAAFLASGHPLIIPTPERTSERRAATARQVASSPASVLELAGRMLAVGIVGRDAMSLDVALQLEGPPVPVHLWTGPKNAWGSAVVQAEPEAGLPGFLRTEVALRPGSDRLWIGLDRDGLRPAIGALRLS